MGFSLRLLIRVKCRHRGGFGVVVEHGGRICDVVYPVVTVDRMLGFGKFESFSSFVLRACMSLAGWIIWTESV